MISTVNIETIDKNGLTENDVNNIKNNEGQIELDPNKFNLKSISISDGVIKDIIEVFGVYGRFYGYDKKVELKTVNGNINDYDIIFDSDKDKISIIGKDNNISDSSISESERVPDKKYKVICVAGSSKYKDEILKEISRLTLEGNIVISLGVYSHSDNIELSSDDMKMLVDMFYKKIDMSDELYVVNVNGYIGDHTHEDIKYAKSKNIPVKYYMNNK